MALPPSPILVTKLKEGINEAIVFLRMLEGTKLSAVVERRRKGLLDLLLDLVGDTMKETPPSYEPKDDNGGPKDDTTKTSRPSSAGSDMKVSINVPSEKSVVTKQPENAATVEKKQPEKITSPEKAATLEKKQPEKVATLEKKQPEKAATLEKKQPEKAATLEKKPEKVTEAHENADSSCKASPSLGKKNNKSVENAHPGKDDFASSSVSAKGTAQTLTKASEKPVPEPQQPPAELLSSTNELVESVTDDSSVHDSSLSKGKKPHGKGMFKGMFAGKKRDRENAVPSEAAAEPSPVPESPTTIGEPSKAAVEEPQDYCTPEESLAELQGKLSGYLERQVKGMISTNWTKQQVALKDDSIVIEMKTIPLSGCSVKKKSDKGSTGFKLTLPDSEQVVLRAKTEEACMQWVVAIAEVIAACTPVQEVVPTVKEGQEQGDVPDAKDKVAVPQISVTSEASEEGGPAEPMYKNVSIKGSEESLRKRAQEMPDQRVATMKGFVNRKTMFSSEKRWALLTSEPCLYLSQSETSTEFLVRLPLESGKLESKPPATFVVKSGKKETFTVPQGEFSEWHSALEVALGISSGDLELASSDEEDQETYEDIADNAPPPPVPSSPRPIAGRVSVVTSEPDEDQGEDIYEEFDDAPNATPSAAAPSLPPPRTLQKELSPMPGLSLPPKKENPSTTAAIAAKSVPKDKEPSPLSTKGAQKDRETAPLPAKSVPKDRETAPLPAKSVPKDRDPAPLPAKSAPSTAGIPPRPKPPPTVATAAANKKPADTPAKGPPPKPTPVVEDDELYDDVADTAPTDDSYYDDAAGALAGAQPQQDDEYMDVDVKQEGDEEYVPVAMDEGGEEEYVDVDTPTRRISSTVRETQPPLPVPLREAPAPHKSPAPAPKLTPAAVKNKVSSLSTMFEAGKKKEGGGCCGQLMHKGPTKAGAYKDEYAALEGSTPQLAVLNIQRSSVDKKPHTQLLLHDYDLSIGSHDTDDNGGGAALTFKLARNDVQHLFSVKTQEELDRWMLAVRPFAKCVIVAEPKCIYQVKEDHIPAEGGGDQLTLRKDTFVQVLKDKSPTVWIGQCGNYHDIFAGPIGTFPSSKVEPVVADDVYM